MVAMTDDAQARQNPVADYIFDGGDEVAKLKAELAYTLGQLEASNEEIEQLRQDLDEAKSTAWDILIKEKAQARREGFEECKKMARNVANDVKLGEEILRRTMADQPLKLYAAVSSTIAQAIASLTYPE
jgi:hypothetical protein